MSESRLVPSNLMAWPRIRALLPDQKLLVYHLWATCREACGCALIDLGAFQGALSLTQEAISEALDDFQRRRLVAQDVETGEVFILDWFRFHKFDSPVRKRLLSDSIGRIQSQDLMAIIEKSMSCISREGKVREGKGRKEREPLSDDVIKIIRALGVEVPEFGDGVLDKKRATQLLSAGEEVVRAIVLKLSEAGQVPYLSAVAKAIAYGGSANDDGAMEALREIERTKKLLNQYASA